MNKPVEIIDPCKLRSLPSMELEDDLWPDIQAQLQQPVKTSSSYRPQLILLAASVLLAVILIQQMNITNLFDGENQATGSPLVTQNNTTEEIDQQSQLHRLITMSQALENRIYAPQLQNSPLSANEAVMIAELEDMIAVVDRQLSQHSGDPELWYRRVALLTDLAGIYQQRRARDYSQYVAL